jgi:hypothetical protein
MIQGVITQFGDVFVYIAPFDLTTFHTFATIPAFQGRLICALMFATTAGAKPLLLKMKHEDGIEV